MAAQCAMRIADHCTVHGARTLRRRYEVIAADAYSNDDRESETENAKYAKHCDKEIDDESQSEKSSDEYEVSVFPKLSMNRSTAAESRELKRPFTHSDLKSPAKVQQLAFATEMDANDDSLTNILNRSKCKDKVR